MSDPVRLPETPEPEWIEAMAAEIDPSAFDRMARRWNDSEIMRAKFERNDRNRIAVARNRADRAYHALRRAMGGDHAD